MVELLIVFALLPLVPVGLIFYVIALIATAIASKG